MSSSTSSSDRPVPRIAGRWAQVWAVAAALSLVLLLAMELGLRRHGVRPSVADDLDLWSAQRSRVEREEDAIVVIGASRAQYGLDTEILREQTGRSVLVLADHGRSPLPILRDLAALESFHGLVLSDLPEEHLLPEFRENSQDLVAGYHRGRSIAQRVDRLLRTELQTRLALLHPDFSAPLMMGRQAGTQTALPLRWKGADRSGGVAYGEHPDLLALRERMFRGRQSWLGDRSFAEIDWRALSADYAEPVRKIRRRGGEVVFLRFPTSHEWGALDRELFPREEVWEVFLDESGARGIHFDDVASLREIVAPEGSHLDHRDRGPVTRALVDELRRQGVLPGDAERAPSRPALALETDERINRPR